jgi:hypothetical protein
LRIDQEIRTTSAPSLRMEINPLNVRDADEIEHAVAAFARSKWRQE